MKYLTVPRIGKPVSPAIKKYVDGVWQRYDVDNTGYLDRYESKKYIEELMRQATNNQDFKINNLIFTAVFNKFDKDKNGRLSKDEVYILIDEWKIQILDSQDEDEDFEMDLPCEIEEEQGIEIIKHFD